MGFLKELAAFNLAESSGLWSALEGKIAPQWAGGRERDPTASEKGGFIILLAALRAAIA